MNLIQLLNDLEESSARTGRLVAEIRSTMGLQREGPPVTPSTSKKSGVAVPQKAQDQMNELFATGLSIRKVAQACKVSAATAGRYRKAWEKKRA